MQAPSCRGNSHRTRSTINQTCPSRLLRESWARRSASPTEPPSRRPLWPSTTCMTSSTESLASTRRRHLQLRTLEDFAWEHVKGRSDFTELPRCPSGAAAPSKAAVPVGGPLRAPIGDSTALEEWLRPLAHQGGEYKGSSTGLEAVGEVHAEGRAAGAAAAGAAQKARRQAQLGAIIAHDRARHLPCVLASALCVLVPQHALLC